MSENQQVEPGQTRWGAWLLGIIIFLFAIGIGAILTYSIATTLYDDAHATSARTFLRTCGVSTVIAMAALSCGGLVGFLFGIPHPATNGPSGVESNRPDPRNYVENTNLVQISDWLTKILVGVGLTQLIQMPTALSQLSIVLARGLGEPPGGGVFGTGLSIQFALLGFLSSYIATTWYLPVALEQFRYESRVAAIAGLVSRQNLALSPAATPSEIFARMPPAVSTAVDQLVAQPFDSHWSVERKTAWAQAAMMKKRYRDSVRAYEDAYSDATTPADRSRILGELTFTSLYLPVPDSYLRAIVWGRLFLRDCIDKNANTADANAYLACAYAQKYRDLSHTDTHRSKKDFTRSRKLSLQFLREAISSDPSWKQTLRDNWKGVDPEENDLAVFADDPKFAAVFGAKPKPT